LDILLKQYKIKMTTNDFEIKLDRETINDLKQLINFANKNFPFLPTRLLRLEYQLNQIIINGCFKHGIMCETFETGINSSITICPKCNPDEYKKYKIK